MVGTQFTIFDGGEPVKSRSLLQVSSFIFFQTFLYVQKSVKIDKKLQQIIMFLTKLRPQRPQNVNLFEILWIIYVLMAF